MANFKAYNLTNKMVDALNKLHYFSASPIQDFVIPKALQGSNIIAKSQTGSGKTHAFLIPIIDRLDMNKKTQAIIISPTRELAKQTYQFAKEFTKFYPDLKISLLTPEKESTRDEQNLNVNPQIIIATPGRMKEMLLDKNTLSLKEVKTVVFDEVDMLMEEGFIDIIEELVGSLKTPQIMIFSATIPEKVENEIISKLGKNICIDRIDDSITPSRIQHFLIDTKHKDIIGCVKQFIQIQNPYFLIIFSSKKDRVKEIYTALKNDKYNVGVLHGDLLDRERKAMIRRIRANEFQYVVCSDMASRGLDLEDVSDVLSVDFPSDLSFYFHRAGRTGRFDKEGNCFSFYDNDSIAPAKKLMDMGVKFSFLSMKDGEFEKETSIVKERPKKKRASTELDSDIKKAVALRRTKKVKPNYKKRVKIEVEKVKKRHRRKMIKEDIRRQRVERYKEEGKNKKYDD